MSNIIDQINTALATMYSNVSQDEKMKATHFLEDFQKSQSAWEIIFQILNDSTSNSNLQLKIFASQTLRSKIIYDLSSQLSETNYPEFKDNLLSLITKYNSPNEKLIRTQLSIALSHFSLQYLNWKNAINEIIDSLSSESYLPILLEFLKILPEELSDVKKTNLTDEEYNTRTQELITNNIESVLIILKNLTEGNKSHDLVLNSTILDCLNSWIKECPIESILHINSLTNLIFESLTNDKTFDRSIECLVTIISETRDIENYEIIDALYQQIIKLNEFVISNPDKLEDGEFVDGLTRLYVTCGESWHVLIGKNPKHFKSLVSILLNCCKYDEDLDIVRYTFQFWNLLKQLITLPKYHEARNEFNDIYSQLIQIIIKHLTYPIVEVSDLFQGDKEQEDKFKEFRYEMGDVLKDCCSVIGAQQALQIPFNQIQSIISKSNGHWQDLESALFSMRTMAKVVSTKESKILPTIMSFLVQLPEHPKVRYAATLVLGRYTEWTANNPQFLEPQLNYITKGFEIANDDKDIILATSHALMYFCQDCSKFLVNYLEQLYMLYSQVKSNIDYASNYELIDGLAHVVKQVPEGNQYEMCQMFLEPSIDKLQELSISSQNETVNVSIADEVEVIRYFIEVFKINEFEKSEYPIATFFIKKIWPILTSLITKFGINSLKVSERCLNLIKTAIMSFSSYLNDILPTILNLLHQGYKLSPQFGCYLWVTGVVIRIYGDEEFNNPEILKAVYEFSLIQCDLFFNYIFNLSQQELQQLPDLIEDFFRMINDYLMFFPFQIIPDHNLLNKIVKASNLTLSSLNEFNPIISCIHFLIDLVSWGLPNPPISLFEQKDTTALKSSIQQFLILNNQGGEILRILINGIIFKFHDDLLQEANDLCLKILVVVPNHEVVINWLKNIVLQLPNVNEVEINRLIETVNVALMNKDNRRVRVSLRDFISWYKRKNVNRSEF
ncbi:unnamed protein product [Candida verbasci]|uniref:Importin N-terminal domain-containing protein n=1 Tax=Candida verbasci TaxID=1227364 RepID=A0A9W4XI70_9ASCO|nr:unnamed protein product [Candida verbasci]